MSSKFPHAFSDGLASPDVCAESQYLELKSERERRIDEIAAAGNIYPNNSAYTIVRAAIERTMNAYGDQPVILEGGQ